MWQANQYTQTHADRQQTITRAKGTKQAERRSTGRQVDLQEGGEAGGEQVQYQQLIHILTNSRLPALTTAEEGEGGG